MDQASQIITQTNLTVLSGDDSLTLPMLAMGGHGVISVVANIVPRDMIALIDSFRSGNLGEAQAWHRRLFPLCRDMLGLSTNPIPIKSAMKLLGRDTGELRMPMLPLSEADEARLRSALTEYGLMQAACVR
jgi:4-hydroxy-tetrahydrodipicolinate synthase